MLNLRRAGHDQKELSKANNKPWNRRSGRTVSLSNYSSAAVTIISNGCSFVPTRWNIVGTSSSWIDVTFTSNKQLRWCGINILKAVYKCVRVTTQKLLDALLNFITNIEKIVKMYVLQCVKNWTNSKKLNTRSKVWRIIAWPSPPRVSCIFFDVIKISEIPESHLKDISIESRKDWSKHDHF